MASESSEGNKDSKRKLYPRPLGSITGKRSESGTISILTFTPSLEQNNKESLRDRTMSETPPVLARTEEPLKIALNDDDGGRERANTAPPALKSADEITNTSKNTEQPTLQKDESAVKIETKESAKEQSALEEDEDEEIRMAKAMALAIQSNPNLTPDEIRELVGAPAQQNIVLQHQPPPVNKTAQPATNTMLIPGRLNAMLAKDETEMTTPPSSRKSQTFRERAKGRLSDIWTTTNNSSKFLDSNSSQSLDDSSEIKQRPPEQHVSITTTTTTTPSAGLRLPFRQTSKTTIPRSPPISPVPSYGEASTITTTTTTPMEGVPTAPTLAADKPVSSVPSTIPPYKKTVPIRLTGIAWKRRGGMGKYSASGAWERRRIELQGTKLLYYQTDRDVADEAELSPTASKDEVTVMSAPALPMQDDGATEGVVVMKKATWFEQAAANWVVSEDPTAPRGYIDLAKEKATVHAAFGHSGAPSPFAISIKIRGETKWKLCFDYHKIQMEWLAALTDIVVQNSVDTYNAQLLDAANPVHHTDAAFIHSLQLKEPPVEGQDHASAHRLWMMEAYNLQSQPDVLSGEDEVDDDDELGPEDAVEELEAEELSGTATGEPGTLDVSTNGDDSVPTSVGEDALKSWLLPERHLPYAVGLMNVALLFARASSTTLVGFWYLVVGINLGVYLCLVKEPDWRSAVQQIRATSPMANTRKSKRKVKQKKDVGISKPKKTDYVPVAGSTTVNIKNPTDPPVNSKEQVFGGWRHVSGENLLIRSHGYLATRKKVPSPGELYECTAVEIFESPQRYPDMAKRVKLPEVKFDDNGAPKTWRTPDIFIVSIALPTDPPKLGRTSSDGGGYTVTIYYTMKQETRDILRRVTAEGYDPSQENNDDPQKSKVNAVRLLEEWVRRAPSDPKWFSRFKVVPNAHNLKEIGMPGWIAKYNGKPFLIKRPGTTGFIHSHPELSCVEFDVSLHPFPYLAKQAICFMKESYFKKILVSFGFVIEGKSDDELPECLIGCMQLCYPDPKYAIQAHTFFDGTCPRSTD